MRNLINKKTKLFYSILILCFFLLGIGAFGQNISAQKPLEVVYPGKDAPFTTDTPLPDYVKYIYIMAVTIVGLIILGVLIRAGYIYLTSAGAPAARGDAKKRIIAAFLGAIILLSSFLILYTLNPQLVMMNIGRPEKAPTSTPPIIPVSTTTEKTFTFFQIPAGKIIERAILDANAQSTFDAAILTANDIEKKSEALKNLTQELKTLTDACQCNQSSCSSIDGASGAGCSNLGCPWAVCDKSAIEKKVENIKTAITDLQNAQKNLAAPNTFMTDNLLEIKKAVGLMSLLGDGIEDYNTMLTDRHFLEENNYKIEFDYFPAWQDIKIKENNVTVNDPATLYFKKKGNEEIIEMVRQYKK